ncbi:OsmC family protein [Agromyces binzhouensis]|uniref:OsmC family protein n=1 Tax=Agromyces binzhouensis TaxID=1817495 RepID=UPI0036309C86
MDQAELRALQAPLKDRYRTDPDSAIATVAARAAFVEPGITATVDGWAGPVRTGLHPTTGGDGSDACSGDLLLQALVGCAGVTLRSVATAMGLELRSAEVRAEGVFDARGTLGMSRDVPVGLLDVVVTAIVDTDADDATLERLRTGTERFCVVARSLAETPEFVIERAAR